MFIATLNIFHQPIVLIPLLCFRVLHTLQHEVFTITSSTFLVSSKQTSAIPCFETQSVKLQKQSMLLCSFIPLLNQLLVVLLILPSEKYILWLQSLLSSYFLLQLLPQSYLRLSGDLTMPFQLLLFPNLVGCQSQSSTISSSNQSTSQKKRSIYVIERSTFSIICIVGLLLVSLHFWFKNSILSKKVNLTATFLSSTRQTGS